MSRVTYISGRPERRFGAGSTQARAAELSQQESLEDLEELAVSAGDAQRRAELHEAIRLGRGARDGTIGSGGAVRADRTAGTRHGGRIVLQQELFVPPPMGPPTESPTAPTMQPPYMAPPGTDRAGTRVEEPGVDPPTERRRWWSLARFRR